MTPQVSSWQRLSARCNDRFEFLSLAPTPHEEECTPAGGSTTDQIIESSVLIEQLIRIHGEPPEGAEFVIIRNEHEAGTYYEAGITYVPDGSPSEDYAIECESGIPDKWDENSHSALRERRHSKYQPAQPAVLRKHQGKVMPINTKSA